MEDEIQGLDDYLAILRRRKGQLIWPALLILAISVGLAVFLPSSYRSEATILIEQQEIPSDLVRSTVTSYANERIQIISQRVMTTENLGKIIDRYGLYADRRPETSLSLLAEQMREDIGEETISADVVDPRSGRPTTATIAFKLSFTSKDPRLAQKVTNELASLYLNENLKQREKSALETTGFLAKEAEKLQQEVKDLESRLADFKEKNINNLPEHQQLNIQLMERSDRELADTKQQIRSLEEREIYLKSQLAQLSPTSDLYDSKGKRIMGIEDRLSALQTEYAGLAAHYTEQHPTLVKMRREIEALKIEAGESPTDMEQYRRQLEADKAELARLRVNYSEQHPDVIDLRNKIKRTQATLDDVAKARETTKVVGQHKADNPAYIDLQTQLNATRNDLASLKQQRRELEAKIADFEKRLMTSPQVEREYRNLTRDYDNALAKYQEVKAKQLEAELAESLERERKGDRFSLIEPPQFPEEPASPNRVAILFLGFLFSLAGGGGNVALRESMDKSIHGAKDLVSVTGAPPLAVIPFIENDGDRRRLRRRRYQIAVAVLFVLLAGAAAIHFLFMPLDVLWFVVLRKLGVDTAG